MATHQQQHADKKAKVNVHVTHNVPTPPAPAPPPAVPNPALQVSRCTYLSSFLTNIATDPNVSPVVNVAALTKLATALTTMGASITSGAMSPDAAWVSIQRYIITYTTVAGYSSYADFVQALSKWTVSQGGPPHLWVGVNR